MPATIVPIEGVPTGGAAKEELLMDKGISEKMFKHAINIAKENKIKIAMSLSDIFCVKRHREDFLKLLIGEFDRVKMDLDPYNWEVITGWDEKVNKYKNPVYTFKVRDKEIKIDTHTESLSHTHIPKVALPKYSA